MKKFKLKEAVILKDRGRGRSLGMRVIHLALAANIAFVYSSSSQTRISLETSLSKRQVVEKKLMDALLPCNMQTAKQLESSLSSFCKNRLLELLALVENQSYTICLAAAMLKTGIFDNMGYGTLLEVPYYEVHERGEKCGKVGVHIYKKIQNLTLKLHISQNMDEYEIEEKFVLFCAGDKKWRTVDFFFASILLEYLKQEEDVKWTLIFIILAHFFTSPNSQRYLLAEEHLMELDVEQLKMFKMRIENPIHERDMILALARPDIICHYSFFAEPGNELSTGSILATQLSRTVSRLRNSDDDIFAQVLQRARIPAYLNMLLMEKFPYPLGNVEVNEFEKAFFKYSTHESLDLLLELCREDVEMRDLVDDFKANMLEDDFFVGLSTFSDCLLLVKERFSQMPMSDDVIKKNIEKNRAMLYDSEDSFEYPENMSDEFLLELYMRNLAAGKVEIVEEEIVEEERVEIFKEERGGSGDGRWSKYHSFEIIENYSQKIHHSTPIPTTRNPILKEGNANGSARSLNDISTSSMMDADGFEPVDFTLFLNYKDSDYVHHPIKHIIVQEESDEDEKDKVEVKPSADDTQTKDNNAGSCVIQ